MEGRKGKSVVIAENEAPFAISSARRSVASEEAQEKGASRREVFAGQLFDSIGVVSLEESLQPRLVNHFLREQLIRRPVISGEDRPKLSRM